MQSPPEVDDLADAAAGDDGGLPDVTDAAVAGVVGGGEVGQVGLISQRPGDLVGERPPGGPAYGGASVGDRDDELPVQPQPVSGTGLQGIAQQLAGGVEHHGPGGRGDDACGAAGPPDR
jgi:hypothetical protein